jgi:hypothetical protein
MKSTKDIVSKLDQLQKSVDNIQVFVKDMKRKEKGRRAKQWSIEATAAFC